MFKGALILLSLYIVLLAVLDDDEPSVHDEFLGQAKRLLRRRAAVQVLLYASCFTAYSQASCTAYRPCQICMEWRAEDLVLTLDVSDIPEGVVCNDVADLVSYFSCRVSTRQGQAVSR